VRYFRAAAQAWRDEAKFHASTGTLLPPRDRVLVWLVSGSVPAQVTRWVQRGGTALLADTARIAMPDATAALWRDASGNTLMEGGPLGAGRLLRFTRPLTPSAMPELLDAEFAARLRDLVAPAAPPPARVVSTVFAPTTGIARYALPARELSSWLGLLIALAFLAERLLATRRRRVSA
jgi:hypothetical protein